MNQRWLWALLFLCMSTVALAEDVSTPPKSGAIAVSSANFDPDGYYFPASKLPKQFNFEHIELDGLPLYMNSTATEAKATIDNDYDCRVPTLTPDLITIECPNLPFGDLLLTGKFLDTRGNFWERDHVIPKSTVVMICDLVIRKSGKPIYKQKDLAFSYWEGH